MAAIALLAFIVARKKCVILKIWKFGPGEREGGRVVGEED